MVLAKSKYCAYICIQSYDIVRQVAILLLDISSNLSYSTIAVASSALQALIEMCTGNYLNQETAFKGLVTESINHILSFEEIVPPESEDVLVSVTITFTRYCSPSNTLPQIILHTQE